MAELQNEYENDLEGSEEDGLPKRGDDKYKEIKNFKPYELTQCIAYEMGIRNVVVKDLLDELNYFSERKSYLINGTQTISHPAPEKYNKYSKLGILHLNELIEEHEKRLIDEYLLYPYEQNNESKEINNYLTIRKILNNTPEKPEYDYKWNHRDNQGFRIYQGIFTNSTTYDMSHIFTNFKRQVKYVNKAEITLNMSLPKKEILAYISHVLDTLSSSNDKQLKSSLELLFGEIFDEAEKTNHFPKIAKASKMADLLFIYDYIKARQKQINLYNEDEDIERSKDIYAIQANKELSGSDKKTQIAELNKKHTKNKVDTLITEICNEDNLLRYLDVKADMVLKYYYAIKPYIEDYKYKELITGTALAFKKQDEQ
ncbi:MAG: hypothetical protein Q7T77_01520 [Sulfuricurvum sp.]|jgi:hypothetical protein|nr:hypothetical protein [Sulfuricurvum sp.]